MTKTFELVPTTAEQLAEHTVPRLSHHPVDHKYSIENPQNDKVICLNLVSYFQQFMCTNCITQLILLFDNYLLTYTLFYMTFCFHFQQSVFIQSVSFAEWFQPGLNRKIKQICFMSHLTSCQAANPNLIYPARHYGFNWRSYYLKYQGTVVWEKGSSGNRQKSRNQ